MEQVEIIVLECFYESVNILLKKKIPEYITNERKEVSPDEQNADKEMFDHEDFKED